MSMGKILVSVAFLSLLIVPASANWFNASLAPQTDDLEAGTSDLLKWVIRIAIAACALSVLYGGIFHKTTALNNGLRGFGILAAVFILVAFFTDFSDYYTGKYW